MSLSFPALAGDKSSSSLRASRPQTPDLAHRERPLSIIRKAIIHATVHPVEHMASATVSVNEWVSDSMDCREAILTTKQTLGGVCARMMPFWQAQAAHPGQDVPQSFEATSHAAIFKSIEG